jgi:hypothetical protein
MNFVKFSMDKFEPYSLLASDLKSLQGRGQPTNRGAGMDHSGPDWIFDECSTGDGCRTAFSDGATLNDCVQK